MRPPDRGQIPGADPLSSPLPPRDSPAPRGAEGFIPVAQLRGAKQPPAGESERDEQRESPPRAAELFRDARPLFPGGHLVDVQGETYLFLTNGSRLYGIGEEMAEALAASAPGASGEEWDALLSAWGLTAPPYILDEPPRGPEVRALSLAVAQTCNLGCTYCYAQEGSFGGPSRAMPAEVALASVTRLLQDARPGERVTLAFLGGEPLANRPVLRAATVAAAERAEAKGVKVGFSLTTNGTLLTPDDGDFFETYGFAVTVSLDGVGDQHDRLRPFKGGRGSYQRILERVEPLLRRQRRMQISARATVTPRNLDLSEMLETFIRLGFHSVGFSPLLSSPTGKGEMGRPDLALFLEQMVACGEAFEREVTAGRRYPFANLAAALREIHRGTHRPYPCGAGAGYLGVSAGGDLYACHRFVNDDRGWMGTLGEGVDPARQGDWLTERHVHRQEPCRECWARYLCGGGCHHEVIHRGRPACDYIRGWLHFCLQVYVRLRQRRPEFFAPEFFAPEFFAPAGAGDPAP